MHVTITKLVINFVTRFDHDGVPVSMLGKCRSVGRVLMTFQGACSRSVLGACRSVLGACRSVPGACRSVPGARRSVPGACRSVQKLARRLARAPGEPDWLGRLGKLARRLEMSVKAKAREKSAGPEPGPKV